MKVDWSGDVLMIEFDDGRGCHIDALLPKKYWKNSEDLKTRLRNINIGDQLTVEGVFDVDNRINALMRLDSVIW